MRNQSRTSDFNARGAKHQSQCVTEAWLNASALVPTRKSSNGVQSPRLLRKLNFRWRLRKRLLAGFELSSLTQSQEPFRCVGPAASRDSGDRHRSTFSVVPHLHLRKEC